MKLGGEMESEVRFVMRTMPDYLKCLRDGECTAAEVAQKLGVKESAVTQMFKRASRKGLVSVEDGVFELTDLGRSETSVLASGQLSADGQDSLLGRIHDLLEQFRQEIKGAAPPERDDADEENSFDSRVGELLGLELALSAVGRTWLRKRRDDLASKVDERSVEAIRHLVLLEEGFIAEASRFFGPDKQRLEEHWKEIGVRRGEIGLPPIFDSEDQAATTDEGDGGADDPLAEANEAGEVVEVAGKRVVLR